jgi:uncharacterized protein YidB (DUF937 family)
MVLQPFSKRNFFALVAKGEIFSMSNQQYEETLEEQSNKELASILGISYDELCQLEWDVDTNILKT